MSHLLPIIVKTKYGLTVFSGCIFKDHGERVSPRVSVWRSDPAPGANALMEEMRWKGRMEREPRHWRSCRSSGHSHTFPGRYCTILHFALATCDSYWLVAFIFPTWRWPWWEYVFREVDPKLQIRISSPSSHRTGLPAQWVLGPGRRHPGGAWEVLSQRNPVMKLGQHQGLRVAVALNRA
jgi:hypothetical protein